MSGKWKLSVWGVRGSFPTPGRRFGKFGGHTSCLSLDCGDTLVVLDAGSGLAELGQCLAQEGRRRVDILLSHLHLDHVMGLFSFPLLYDPEAEIHLYGRAGFAQALARLVGPPYWPVALADSAVRFHEVAAGQSFPLAGLTVTPAEGNHPGGCCHYRLEGDGHSLVYALDCELTAEFSPRLASLVRPAGLLVWDACFLPGQVKPGWGHSTWEEGASFGRLAGANQVLMTHYGADCTDELLEKQEQEARKSGAFCQFAREGMVIEL